LGLAGPGPCPSSLRYPRSRSTTRAAPLNPLNPLERDGPGCAASGQGSESRGTERECCVIFPEHGAGLLCSGQLCCTGHQQLHIRSYPSPARHCTFILRRISSLVGCLRLKIFLSAILEPSFFFLSFLLSFHMVQRHHGLILLNSKCCPAGSLRLR
jgi:hypothetical protein